MLREIGQEDSEVLAKAGGRAKGQSPEGGWGQPMPGDAEWRSPKSPLQQLQLSHHNPAGAERLQTLHVQPWTGGTEPGTPQTPPLLVTPWGEGAKVGARSSQGCDARPGAQRG